MQSITVPLSNPVAAGATFTANYPTGKARKDYIQSGAILVVGQSTFTSPTVSLGASSITITNPTGLAIAAGTRVILSLNSPAENAGSASVGALARYAGHIEYPGSPVGNLAPDFVGQQCFDTTNNLWYRAHGSVSTSWRPDTQAIVDGSGNVTGLTGNAGQVLALTEVSPYVNRTSTGTAFSGACEFAGYICTVAAGNITIYDNTAASGTIIVPTTALALGAFPIFGPGTNGKMRLTTGCHVVLSGAATVNVLVG